MISLHVEVSAAEDILVTHDMIDNIEKQLSRELGCAAIIHMDPILVGDARIDELRLRTAGPVSYTHLDVYKRQPPYRLTFISASTILTELSALVKNFRKKPAATLSRDRPSAHSAGGTAASRGLF